MKQFTQSGTSSSKHLVIYLLLSIITVSGVFSHPIQNENSESNSSDTNKNVTSTTILEDNPILNTKNTGNLRLVKRDVQAEAEESDGREDESNNSGGGYGTSNSYPMILSKRSATVLNKLVHALKSSFDQSGSSMGNLDFSREKESSLPNRSVNYDRFNLQRRNQQQKDRKNYLRCYFNAVSCF